MLTPAFVNYSSACNEGGRDPGTQAEAGIAAKSLALK